MSAELHYESALICACVPCLFGMDAMYALLAQLFFIAAWADRSQDGAL